MLLRWPPGAEPLRASTIRLRGRHMRCAVSRRASRRALAVRRIASRLAVAGMTSTCIAPILSASTGTLPDLRVRTGRHDRRSRGGWGATTYLGSLLGAVHAPSPSAWSGIGTRELVGSRQAPPFDVLRVITRSHFSLPPDGQTSMRNVEARAGNTTPKSQKPRFLLADARRVRGRRLCRAPQHKRP